jgi:hypothetical protein
MTSNASVFEVRDMFNSNFKLPEIIQQGLEEAVPIWELLGITKEQYDAKYGETEWTQKMMKENQEKHDAFWKDHYEKQLANSGLVDISDTIQPLSDASGNAVSK